MYLPRRLLRGPEYNESLRSVRERGLVNFEENLQAVRGLAKFEPEAATPVDNSELRIAQIYDEVNGYSLVLYFKGTALSETATLVRLQVFDIEPDFQPWDI